MSVRKRRQRVLALAGESAAAGSLDGCMEREEVSILRRLLPLFFAQLIPGRRNVELGHVRAPECAACGMLGGNEDRSLKAAVGIVAENFATIVAHTPEISLVINRQAVGHSRFTTGLYERAAIFDGARLLIKVVRVNDLLRRIGEIHSVIIGTPDQAIGHT